jgi:hypothetical protein
MIKFKPTLKDPMSPQSEKFEKDFKKTMITKAPNVKLNEVDGMLSEVEQSLKKKIFSLAKMEALVFSDPKLSAVYEEMAANGEEKYGYHYNETIQNMIFNDYVLNSPKYLQKYKMAIPKEKKRRDKSGINQLKKAGEKKMTQAGLPKLQKTEVTEGNEPVTKVMFLVNEKDPNDPDLFAYFPEENHDREGKFKTAYSHIGQHSSASPDYAAESRPATPEEYADLKAELESIGYNLEVLNGMQESTSAGSAGGAAGYVGYAGPAAWSTKGDLMGGGKKTGQKKHKPTWKGGTIIQESNYLTESSGFEKYIEELDRTLNGDFIQMNEQSDIDFIPKHSQAYGTVNNMNPKDRKVIKQDIKTRKLDTNAGIKGGIALTENPDNFEQAKEKALNISKEEGVVQHVNQVSDNNFKVSDWYDSDNTVVSFENGKQLNENISPDMYSTKEDLKELIQSVKQRTGKGLTRDHIPMLAGEALYSVAISLADKMLPVSWNELPDTNSMWDYIDQNGNMSYDKLMEAVKEAVNDRLSEEGMSLEDLGEAKLNEKSKSKAQQRFMGMVHAVQKGELPASKVGGDVERAAKSMTDKDAEDFASTKHKGLPEKLDEFLSLHDVVEYVSDRSGEEPFEMHGQKWQFVNAKYPNGKIDIGVYKFGHDLVYDYARWREEMGIDENKIKEDMQTMIQNNNTSMSNKAQATGDQSSGGVPVGTQATGGLQESDMKLLEEINKELEAFSIHHNKLKLMAEDKKTPSMVLGDRIRAENPKNFKKDFQNSDTKDVIDVEKELQWKDQQTDVGDDPQELGQDIEKQEIKVGDMKSGEALKNVGDSTNRKGDEIPKRNLTTKEQEEVNLYRQGLHSPIFDNEPNERFKDRMKADMGDEIYDQREKQIAFKGTAPTYNKDDTFVKDAKADKVQFDKEQTGWNERMGLGKEKSLKESMITGRYIDALGKRRLIEFRLSESVIIENAEDYFPLDFTGLGNTYNSKTVDKKVVVNETVVNAMASHKFFTDGKAVVVVKNPVQTLNEGDVKEEKPVVNEQVDKMKHLLGYKPNSFVSTKNVKQNRGF